MTQKIIVDRGELYSALQKIVQVIPKGRAADKVPFMRYVHLSAGDGELVIRGVNKVDTLIVRIPAQGEIQTYVLAPMLLALIKPEGKLEASEVEIEETEAGSIRVEVDSFITKIKPLTDTSEYPEVPRGKWKLIVKGWDSKEFKTILAYGLLAASRDETRPRINCVALIDRKLIATDGHRLHTAVLPSKVKSGEVKVSIEAAQLCQKLLVDGEKVSFKQKKEQLLIQSSNWELYSKNIPDEYIPYNQVIPAECDIEVKVDREKLTAILKRLKCVSHSVKIILQGDRCKMITDNPEFGETETEVAVTVVKGDAVSPLVIGFDIQYVLDAIDFSFETVTCKFSGFMDPMVVEAEVCRQSVVMPMRI